MEAISDARDGLQSQWRSLQTQWLETRGVWRDQVAAHFEREFWSFWEAEMPPLLRALEELDEALEQALRRTEDP